MTCSFAHFDWHGSNFKNARKVVPLLDQGIAALVQDLHERGMEKDVTVLVWGEFGAHTENQQTRRPRPLAARPRRVNGRGPACARGR